MAPLEPDALTSNLKPLAIFATQSGLIIGLVSTIGRFFARAHNDLPPSYHTRHRTQRLHRNLGVFSALAATGFLVALYHAVAWRVASYRGWAYQTGVDAPGALWQGWYANGDVSSGWQLGRWIADVNLGKEADEALTAGNGALWWTVQHFVSLVSWSVFVGLEGRHRNFPPYIAFCFVLLAQSASLATSMALFFVALTLTPVPLAAATEEGEAAKLTAPHPIQLLVPALWSFIYVFFLPVLQENTTVVSAAGVGYFVVPLLVCALAQPNYLHKSSHSNIHSARLSYTTIFRILSWSTLSIHLVRSFYAITDAAPPTRESRYNYVWNSHSYKSHSFFDKTTTVASKFFGTLSDNPVTAGVAWDVLLAEATLFAWAVTRSLDPRAMLAAAGLYWSRQTSNTVSAKASEAYASLEDSASSAGNAIRDAGASAAATASSVRKTAEQEIDDIVAAAASSTGSTALHNLRASLRSSSANPPDSPTQQTSSAAQGTKRGRGRPKKTTQIPASPSKSSHHGDEGVIKTLATASDDESGAYRPDAATRRQMKDMPVYPAVEEEDVVEETEAGGVAWGLFALGGLGVAAAGVLGAEVSGGVW